MPTFHERLRKLKKKRRVTAKEIARACQVAPQSVYGWLNDVSPRSIHMASLSSFFGVTTDWLVNGNQSPTRTEIVRELREIIPQLTEAELRALLAVAREFSKKT